MYEVSSSSSESDHNERRRISLQSSRRRSTINTSTRKDSAEVDMSKYVGMMQNKVPAVARIIRSHRNTIHRINKRRKEAPVMKDQLKDELGLKVDLGDCSDDSYVDNDVRDDVSLSSNSDNDDSNDSDSDSESISDDVDDMVNVNVSNENMNAQSTPTVDASKYIDLMQGRTPRLVKKIQSHRKTMRRIIKRRKDSPLMKNQLKDELGLKVDLNDCSDDSYVDNDVRDDVSLSSNSDYDDINDSDSLSSDMDDMVDANTSLQSTPTVDTAKYVRLMQSKAPAAARIIRSHRNTIHRISKRRKEAPVMKDQLKDELGLKVDLGDCSDDSYVDNDVRDDVSLSSNSDNDDSNDSDSESDNGVEGTPSSRVAVSKRVVSKLFSKPKGAAKLSDRIRSNRDNIMKVGLKRRAQGIEDAFVMNTQARRASVIANQARAHTKLQKRIEQRKFKIMDNVIESDNDSMSLSLVDSIGEDKRSGQRGPLQKLSSFELFNAKKAMVTNYAGHDELRKRTLEKERAEAKAALQARVRKKRMKSPSP